MGAATRHAAAEKAAALCLKLGGGPLCPQCLYYASRNVFPRVTREEKHVETLQHTTMCHCTRSVEGVASIEQLSRLQCDGYFRPCDLCTQKFLLIEEAFVEARKRLSFWGCLVLGADVCFSLTQL